MLKALDETLGLKVLALPAAETGLADDIVVTAGQWVACGAALRGQARPGAGDA